MDPQVIALLQEAQQTIAMQSEEIQALREQLKKPASGEMQKKASVEKLASLTGFRQEDLPEFVKLANEDELRDFMSSIENRARHTTIGKVAEIFDGSMADTPGERLEASLANLV